MKHLLVFALAALFVVREVSAEELTGTLKAIKETGTITLGYRESSIPFSYLSEEVPDAKSPDKTSSRYSAPPPIGFATDICSKIVDVVKKELKLDKLEVKLE